MVIFFLKKDFIWDKNTSISLKFKKVRLLVLFSILFPDRVFSQGPNDMKLKKLCCSNGWGGRIRTCE